MEILQTMFSCACVGERKQRFLKNISLQAQLPVNAHVPIKVGTIFGRYWVFVWAGKKDYKAQGVNAFFFLERDKKSLFSDKNRYIWTGPKKYKDTKTIKQTWSSFSLFSLMETTNTIMHSTSDKNVSVNDTSKYQSKAFG